jgi:hypothetical protein
MANKGKFWLWLAGIGAFLLAFFLGSRPKPDGNTGELEKEAAWHKEIDKDEQKRLDAINDMKGSREGIHDETKDRFSKKISGILLAVIFFSAVMIDAKYIKMVDGELRDFDTQERYEEFLETDRAEYQKDVEIRDREIDLLKQNNTTKSNIIAIQGKELDVHRRREKPLHRFVEKVDYAVGVSIGFILALLSSKVYKNLK